MKINAIVNGDGYHVDNKKWEHHRFKVTLEYQGRTMDLVFSQGVGIDHDPTAEEIIYCVLSDAAGMADEPDFESWAGEYGYDTDSRQVEKIYNACREQTARFNNMLGTTFDRILEECQKDDAETVAKRWAGVTQ